VAFLMTLSGNLSGLSVAAARSLGQAEMPVALVVTAEGCDQLNKAAGRNSVCRVAPGEKTAVVCPALLRSRIGSPFFVELSPFERDGHWPQAKPPARLAAISLEKKEAPNWTRLAPMPAASAVSAARGHAPNDIATFIDGKQVDPWLREQCGPAPLAANSASSAPPPRV
jgi:hypothetical protein